MDFSLPPEIEDYRQRVRSFVEREIMPVEADRANWDEHENIGHAALEQLRAKAKAEGLWSLQMPK
jgi:acyl-CoA dehydrogenase